MEEPKSSQTPKCASYKRIILCADGTWTASNSGEKTTPSNVARIARAISNNGVVLEGDEIPQGAIEKGTLVKQVVYYTAGLGATDMAGQKALYGAFGWGIDVEICQMYDFISNNYEAGDELLFFGFSRGAFTVRCVASLVAEVGILSAINMPNFADMWNAYRSRPTDQPFRDTTWHKTNKKAFGFKDVEVKVVGVWDTVAALGLPEYSWVKWFGINKKYKFHDLDLSANVKHAFQALALDERRKTFPAAVWQPKSNSSLEALKQCWFPGTHGDIGGPGDNAKAFEDIGDITFAWMVDNLSGMLTFEKEVIDDIEKQHRLGLENCVEQPNGWGCQTISSNFSGFTGKFFWLLGVEGRTPGSYGDNTNEFIHPIARLCKESIKEGQKWDCPALQTFTTAKNSDGEGHTWRSRTASISEYKFEAKKMITFSNETAAAGESQYQGEKPLWSKLCPTNVMKALPGSYKSKL